ncbi:hypothetical protein ABEG18_13865 [Alsobacter sp. KACC 23698]|uniref:Uncharacterized protein n=1 Tax=Alsobacter sp. KACC 23698 TaxID=3149229 RepID=A0AAU7J973_9HYPH
MPLYLFTNAQFSLAVCADGEGRGLPPGDWTLLKEVDPAEIDAAIVARVAAEGHWYYRPGRSPADAAQGAADGPPPEK